MRTTRSARVAGLAAIALTAAACGSGDSGTASDDDGVIELTVATFNEFGYDELYQEYMDAHPNIRIVERKAGTAEAAIENLRTKLAAGSGLSDIEAVEEAWMVGFLAQADKFHDLRDYGADDIADRWLPWKFEAGTAPGGEVIGYGTDIGPMALCYRRDLFEQAGLPADRDVLGPMITDWASYFDLGVHYVEAMGEGYAWYDTAGNIFQAMQNQLEVGYYDTDDNLVAAENDAIKANFDAVVTANEAGLSANLQTWSEDWAKAFQTDAFATLPCPSWFLGVIEGNAKGREGTWDVVDAFPGGGGNWGGSYLTVPKQTDHPEEAAELAAWLTAPEQQVKAFVAKGTFPSQVEALESAELAEMTHPFFNDAPTGTMFVNRALAVGEAQYKGPRDGDVNQALQNSLRRIEDGSQEPDAAWEQFLEDAERVG
ncbi:extracellular solute-binding protein [Haloactinopolyspora sp.]|uniref:ABC transporter substrate-binding protein n=1 Tax=Haloactinopolyspora sp. TaxID=1966353 RepID=UPI002609A2B1|nr:extracellular solute-binding protein [Haloactinopolyspora sp.]